MSIQTFRVMIRVMLFFLIIAATMVTAMKTLFENKHLENGKCFVIVVSSSHPLLLIEHAKSGLVKAPLK